MEYYAQVKKEEDSGTCENPDDPEDVMLSEVS